jgi:osmoprotectant transport system ATP-binding protein
MPRLVEFRDVFFSVAGRPVLDNFCFAIDRGECVVLLGASGSGKTTALRLVNALLYPQRGDVRVDGLSTRAWNPIDLRRRTGYVIQDGGLFPHRTVRQNVATVPRLLNWTPTRIEQRTIELLTLAGLDPTEYASRYPRELSGGQRQRVAVARALAAEPLLLLLDEPFSALDPVTRLRAQQQIQTLRDSGATILLVTHDLTEALRLGTRIALLDQGRIAVDSTPDRLRQEVHPALRPFLEAAFS